MAEFRRKRRFDVDREMELERLLAQSEGELSSPSVLVDASERYSMHPSLFAKETFAWGMARSHLDESQGLLSWHEDVLGQLEESLQGEDTIHRLAISGGKGIGKTCLASMLFLWHLS